MSLHTNRSNLAVFLSLSALPMLPAQQRAEPSPGGGIVQERLADYAGKMNVFFGVVRQLLTESTDAKEWEAALGLAARSCEFSCTDSATPTCAKVDAAWRKMLDETVLPKIIAPVRESEAARRELLNKVVPELPLEIQLLAKLGGFPLMLTVNQFDVELSATPMDKRRWVPYTIIDGRYKEYPEVVDPSKDQALKRALPHPPANGTEHGHIEYMSQYLAGRCTTDVAIQIDGKPFHLLSMAIVHDTPLKLRNVEIRHWNRQKTRSSFQFGSDSDSPGHDAKFETGQFLRLGESSFTRDEAGLQAAVAAARALLVERAPVVTPESYQALKRNFDAEGGALHIAALGASNAAQRVELHLGHLCQDDGERISRLLYPEGLGRREPQLLRPAGILQRLFVESTAKNQATWLIQAGKELGVEVEGMKKRIEAAFPSQTSSKS